MTLKTERLLLRPWQDTDADDLYEYAKDARVGPIAGWPPHTSVENSADIIRTVFNHPEVYAVELKENRRAVGCVGILIGSNSNFEISEQEGEIAYWIGVPYWGKGLIPEAVREVMRHAFENLNLKLRQQHPVLCCSIEVWLSLSSHGRKQIQPVPPRLSDRTH